MVYLEQLKKRLAKLDRTIAAPTGPKPFSKKGRRLRIRRQELVRHLDDVLGAIGMQPQRFMAPARISTR